MSTFENMVRNKRNILLLLILLQSGLTVYVLLLTSVFEISSITHREKIVLPQDVLKTASAQNRLTTRQKVSEQNESRGGEVQEKKGSVQEPGHGSVRKECRNVTCPVHLAAKDTWQEVTLDRVAIVFSAYYSEQTSTIFVIGARQKKLSGKLICQMWVRSTSGNLTVSQELSVLDDSPENNGRKYVYMCIFFPLFEYTFSFFFLFEMLPLVPHTYLFQDYLDENC